jgi:two-component system sensor histidine kinase UhpB
MDAEMIAQLSEAGRHAAIPEQVRAIQAAVGHVQRQVRDLLVRLRPTQVTELGLNAAIVDLVRFWTLRRPDIAFSLTLLEDETSLPEALKDVIYRIVQEAANNAVRHGDPKTIQVAVGLDEARILTVSVADDGQGSPPKPGGLGLVGMRERVSALGGALSYGPNAGTAGWTTAARFDLQAAGAPRVLATASS